MRSDGWHALTRELDAWQERGEPVSLWWRDDDAVAMTPALARLIALRAGAGVPLGLAVIPAPLELSLVEAVHGNRGVDVLVHGFAHINHAPPGEKRQELGPHRSEDSMLEELGAGFERLRTLLGERTQPILVPPWNRISSTLPARLPEIGLRGLSTFAARLRARPHPGLAQTNCHVDIIDWHGTRGFRGVLPVLSDLVDTLSARRAARIDTAEPSGVLTHHLVHDDGCWQFLHELFERTTRHPAVSWLSATDAVLAR